MKTLRKGSKGNVVESLQLFLTRWVPRISTDGDFGQKTANAVKKAQRDLKCFPADGVVGPDTYAAFMSAGWLPPTFEQPSVKSSPYPDKPRYKALNQSQKIRKFGRPGTDAENAKPGGQIKVDKSFRKNIVRIDLADYLRNAKKKSFGIRYLDMHKDVEEQWRAFLSELKSKKIDGDIISCAGSWNPRYVRGSTSYFSSHAFATAVDFNAPENWLGAKPAKSGQKGCLFRVIEVAKRYKIYCGIWFRRLDSMHFESTNTDSELKSSGSL